MGGCHHNCWIFQPQDEPDTRPRQEPGTWADRFPEPENRYESPQAQQLLERARELKQRPFFNPYTNRDGGAENAGMNEKI